ncbi:disease resistance protein RUN1 [Rosa chinensis]|uniref:disease resistance protein RUN1 n=1 Tax=Rosa chinensis TaxID=74649 RepID=UPI000D08D6D5|nr:disease resistance protein RUN1 [Rosa chinensis]
MTTQFGASSSSSSSSTIQPSFSSSCATIQSWTYHVFLSFRGEDTRNTFTGHLHNNLVQKGIKTFIDDGLTRGEEISSALFKAIDESKISVIVFSKSYASSKWCLEELVKIMHCNESKQQIVYPIFYKVDPSDVRNQEGSFGQALAHHDNLEKVAGWKSALTKAGNLSGWHFSHGGHESKFIHKIVEEISQQVLNFTYLNGHKYLVGIESHLKHMEKLLCVGESDVRMIGIWGIGGLGKTTIAKTVYNIISHKFEGSCFLENVRERSLKYGGLQELHKFLLSKTLGLRDLEVNSLDEGSIMIKEILSHRRVFLVLDDVNDLDQLKSLVGKSNWFGSGSRIIITTRDKHLLHDVNHIYQVEKLSHSEALELFNFNAFKGKGQMGDYVELIDNVICYAEGLPLVVEVMGSYLRGRSTDTWKDALESCKRDPKFQQVLKLSYDALEPSMKEVFLHIACFFKGKNKNYVMDILEGCDLRPKHSIEVLIEKALISITEANDVWMHDVLEEMGKEIVCQESSEPGERSRLWLYEDVYHVFVHNTGTSKVKGIMVLKGVPDEQIPLNKKSFLKLNGLQILIICGDVFYGDHVDYLPNDLRLLNWKDCQLQYFPSDFYPRKLVALKMDFSEISSPWSVLKGGFLRQMTRIYTSPLGKRLQNMHNLKSVDLGNFNGATTFSYFSRLPNLEELKIRDSQKVKKFEIVEKMKSLKRLDLSGTAIRELPSSTIRCLINLEELTLSGCKKLKHVPCSIFELQHLELLDLSYCKKLVTFPTKSGFSTGSTSLQDKHYVPLSVNLNNCNRLVEIAEIPRERYDLDASGCYRLQKISKLSNILEGKQSKSTPFMDLLNCYELSGNLARDVAKVKKNLPDNSRSTALWFLVFSCRQSECQVFFNGPPYKFGIPEWFTWRRDFDMEMEGLQGCEFRIDFPGNFKWDEDKGLAFCAQTVDNDHQRWAMRSCFRIVTIYINGVCITEVYLMTGWSVWGYLPFDTIIERLSESGSPPPSVCLVKIEFKTRDVWSNEIKDEGPPMQSCGVHVVMPEDEGQFVLSLPTPSVKQGKPYLHHIWSNVYPVDEFRHTYH